MNTPCTIFTLLLAREFISVKQIKFAIRSDKNKIIKRSNLGKKVCKLVRFKPFTTSSTVVLFSKSPAKSSEIAGI